VPALSQAAATPWTDIDGFSGNTVERAGVMSAGLRSYRQSLSPDRHPATC
jgi:hypothetical protein